MGDRVVLLSPASGYKNEQEEVYGTGLDSVEFFTEIHRLELALTSPLSFGICYRNEQDAMDYLNIIDISMKDELRSLREELIAYFYYCITLVDFFYDEIENPEKYSLNFSSPFDELARIRQYLEINPLVAKDQIMRFRRTYAYCLNPN